MKSNAAARSALNYALRTGRLQKAQSCKRCGSCPIRKDGSSMLHGHHEDYNKPLDAVWLCSKCHRIRHEEIGADIGSGHFYLQNVGCKDRAGLTTDEFRAARRRLGFSQEELGRLLFPDATPVSALTMISHKETGKRPIREIDALALEALEGRQKV